ncbi:MAG: hypothetical protein ACK5LX_05990 [Oscillospiraceae bacterium]
MAKRIAGLIAKAAEVLDEPRLNSSLCLIFNGMASMVAIVFLVLYFTGNRGALLPLGCSGVLCMLLANTTDLFPYFLNGIVKRLGGSAAE